MQRIRLNIKESRVARLFFCPYNSTNKIAQKVKKHG
ncbi:hypothetical protein bas07_0022 [Escherichia phage JakobBernoulli]|uniref:Uncharacterized protein n=1 Tax=Escherichia phage JakobBernoulli TaxID=2851971 RepID=A0AAE8AZX9_9CAUD|nr:hypothetical protein bas07_0022 [Escherichia phage JakobBernoulli]